ncbi:MAG: GTPase, partial [Candidatus Aenigmatarchaeota archaeon]
MNLSFRNFFDWILGLFGQKKNIRLGIYGETNVGKTTLANRISLDWTGEEVGKVSEIPHETRSVQKKEKIEIKLKNNKKIILNLLDMPGLATKVDYR